MILFLFSIMNPKVSIVRFGKTFPSRLFLESGIKLLKGKLP